MPMWLCLHLFQCPQLDRWRYMYREIFIRKKQRNIFIIFIINDFDDHSIDT